MRSVEMYQLPKDLTLTLVAGYSVPLRHRIVTRWMELEQGAKEKAPRFHLGAFAEFLAGQWQW